MSSKPSTSYLLSADLKMLQGVLDDAGYTSTTNLAEPRRHNVAARLLISLFQEGMTSPADLAHELDRHFGRFLSPKSTSSFERLRLSIQGLPE